MESRHFKGGGGGFNITWNVNPQSRDSPLKLTKLADSLHQITAVDHSFPKLELMLRLAAMSILRQEHCKTLTQKPTRQGDIPTSSLRVHEAVNTPSSIWNYGLQAASSAHRQAQNLWELHEALGSMNFFKRTLAALAKGKPEDTCHAVLQGRLVGSNSGNLQTL